MNQSFGNAMVLVCVFEIVLSARFPNTKYAPKRAEKICPITVALAAPITPQSKTMMKTASKIIFVTAPMPVTHIPKTGFPDTRTKSQNNCDSP